MDYYLLITEIDPWEHSHEDGEGFNIIVETSIIDQDEYDILTNPDYRSVDTTCLKECMGVTDVEDYLNHTKLIKLTPEQKEIIHQLKLSCLGNNLFEHVMKSIQDVITDVILSICDEEGDE